MTDFYEDDEPIEAVLAAFEDGEKGVTSRPAPRETGTYAAEIHTAEVRFFTGSVVVSGDEAHMTCTTAAT